MECDSVVLPHARGLIPTVRSEDGGGLAVGSRARNVVVGVACRMRASVACRTVAMQISSWMIRSRRKWAAIFSKAAPWARTSVAKHVPAGEQQSRRRVARILSGRGCDLGAFAFNS